MDEFSTYIFKENELKTQNLKVSRERPYYIGILIFLVGVVLYLLDYEYTAQFMLLGYFILLVARVIMSGRIPSIGHRPLALKLTKDSIFIGKDRIEIKNKKDVEIRIAGYQGEGIAQQVAFYQSHNGNENSIKIRYGNKTAEFKFVLESEAHKDKLLRFCEENGFEI